MRRFRTQRRRCDTAVTVAADAVTANLCGRIRSAKIFAHATLSREFYFLQVEILKFVIVEIL
jgi:hypothetical protein